MSLHDLAKSATFETIDGYLQSVADQSPDDISFIIDGRNEQRYTPLHCAIFARNIQAAKAFTKHGADVNVKCHGIPPVHLAVYTGVQPEGAQFGLDCLAHLLESGAAVSSKDDQLYTFLHLAAEYNLASFIGTGLKWSTSASDAVNYFPKMTGLTALHKAASTNSADAVNVLIKFGANLDIKTAVLGQTALHLAAQSGSAQAWKAILNSVHDRNKQLQLINQQDNEGRSPLQLADAAGYSVDIAKDVTTLVPMATQSMTAIITNPSCLEHHTCPPSQLDSPNSIPPENVKRLTVLIDHCNGSLCGADLASGLKWERNGKRAALADVLRVHEWSYIRKVQHHCARLECSDPEDEINGYAHLDGDTAVSSETYNAALSAAGAVCHAVDMVYAKDGNVRKVFCPVRPPGHHAGPKGVVKTKDFGGAQGPDSHGFCILNNVSIGAAYAMNRYRDDVKRVAIVDFDVHHGNGTEETVRWLKPSVQAFPVANPESSGDVFGVMHIPQYKPWFSEDDAQNVLFVSVHGYGPRERGLEHAMPAAAFYPGSGRTALPDRKTVRRHVNAGLPPVRSDFVKSTPTNHSSNVMEQEEGSTENGDNEGKNNDDGEDENSDNDGDFQDESEEQDGDDEDDSEDMMSELIAQQAASGAGLGGIGGLYRRMFDARKMYSSFAVPQTGYPAAAQTPDTSFVNSMPPLILDIGVPLARMDPDSADDKQARVLADLAYRIQWRKYFRDEIFPRLMDFEPDCIFISAGFDAHKKDTINGGYISLIEEDFEWVTDKLVQIANARCDGRVVSVLEGGYQLGGEYCSAFAQSVKSHVRSLCVGNRSSIRYNVDENKAETEWELQNLRVLEELRQAAIAKKEYERMQAYLLAKQRREQAEQEAAQAAEELDAENRVSEEVPQESVAASTVAEPVTEDDGAGRKRRRQQVDYNALNEKLKKEGV